MKYRVVRMLATDEEYAVIERLRNRGRLKTDANVLRAGLFTMAEEEGEPLPPGVFEFKRPGNPCPREAWAAWKAMPPAQRRALMAHRRPRRESL